MIDYFNVYRASDAIVVAQATEIAQLRQLPVIRTCGECTACTSDKKRHFCAYMTRGAPYDNIDPQSAPPSWCVLRGRA